MRKWQSVFYYLVCTISMHLQWLCILRESGLEPKRLRTVAHDASKEPSLILVEARRGGSSGMKLLPPLFIRNPDGSETQEILKIYHREGKP